MSVVTPRTSKRSKRPKIPFGDRSVIEDDGDSNFGHTEDLDKSGGSGLKLVLKVSGSASKTLDTSTVGSETEDSDAERKVKSKKKKKKEATEKKRKGPDASLLLSDDDATTMSRFGAATEDGTSQMAADESQSCFLMRREKRQIPEDQKTPFRRCLEYLHKQLDRKDANGFFAYPVTDSIAPGYSSIISQPMDFYTMLNKIERDEYSNITEFKADYELMMTNCMTYNHPETVYSKEAKRLLAFGQRLLSKDRLIQLRRTLPYMSHVTAAELGFVDETPVSTNSTVTSSAISQTVTEMPAPVVAMLADSNNDPSNDQSTSLMSGIRRFEAIPDDMSPEEILKQAEAAAATAAGRLTLRAPNSKMGFLRRKEDGSTTFNIVNPDNEGIVSEKEKVVTLGAYLGKLSSGTGSILMLKEDRRNKVNPASYLDYGSFCTFAPYYDSSSANISKEDSDLLLSTYYNENGVQYAKSIRHFVENSGDYAVSMVDSLLDLLTSGDHNKTMEILRLREEEREKSNVASDWNDLMSEMKQEPENKVDLSFLDSFVNLSSSSEDNPIIQQQLNLTSKLISELHQTQYHRLSQKLPENLSQIPGPSPAEISLAQSVTNHLTELMKQVAPGDVVGVEQIRSAMGISEPYIVDVDAPDQPADGLTSDQAYTDAILQQNLVTTQDQQVPASDCFSVTGFEANQGINTFSSQAGTGLPQSFDSCASMSGGQQSSMGMMFNESNGNIVSASSQGLTGGQLNMAGGGEQFVLDPEMQELLEQSSIVCLDA